ncbi:hypothetical protein [Glaciecola sp. SC05]|uniref:hypothetical protein n=1 Tax=Glaciecola sp. SC05 TaxID=1987355 RepID=UPI00352751F5
MSDRHLAAVLEVCKRLKSGGSVPSVALIRAKLHQPTPLPEIIRGLKYWQANPLEAEKFEAPKTPDKTSIESLSKSEVEALHQRISQLENALTNLQLEVQALKQQ